MCRKWALLVVFVCCGVFNTCIFGLSFIDPDRMVFDTDGLMYKDSKFSVGLPLDAATASADVSGNAYFRGYVGVTPVITNTLPIDWRQGVHQFLTLPTTVVTQNISFIDPPGSTVVFLVLYRKCPVLFPDSVVWKNGAEFLFVKPTTFAIPTATDPNQIDVISLMYDSVSKKYIGEASIDFKAATQYPDGR